MDKAQEDRLNNLVGRSLRVLMKARDIGAKPADLVAMLTALNASVLLSIAENADFPEANILVVIDQMAKNVAADVKEHFLMQQPAAGSA